MLWISGSQGCLGFLLHALCLLRGTHLLPLRLYVTVVLLLGSKEAPFIDLP